MFWLGLEQMVFGNWLAISAPDFINKSCRAKKIRVQYALRFRLYIICFYSSIYSYFCEVETMDEVKLLKKEWERRRRDDDDSDDGGQGRGLPQIQSAC